MPASPSGPLSIDTLLQQSCDGCGMPDLIIHHIEVLTRTMTLRCRQCGLRSAGQAYRPDTPDDDGTRLIGLMGVRREDAERDGPGGQEQGGSARGRFDPPGTAVADAASAAT